MQKLIAFFRKDFVFSIAFLCAIVSMFFVPPSKNYISYFDFSVLGILFCLMCVVAGFGKCGLLDSLSQALLSRANSLKQISLFLVLICFVSSMFLTNDVALIAFVPLTLITLKNLPPLRLIYLIVLETMAANLGSMLTPIGNPQNLYLYSYYQMDISSFILAVAPICALSFLLLLLLVALIKNQVFEKKESSSLTFDQKSFWIYMALFLLCIATVLRLVDYRVCTLITFLVLFFYDKTLLHKVDYMLLATFASFFVLVGNLSAIDVIGNWISSFMQGHEFLTAICVSQIISNVPAAIMLSNFTEKSTSLLLGCNIGGLGTLVASLASLISYKLYAKSEDAKPFTYLLIFTGLNFLLLLVLCIFSFFF